MLSICGKKQLVIKLLVILSRLPYGLQNLKSSTQNSVVFDKEVC